MLAPWHVNDFFNRHHRRRPRLWNAERTQPSNLAHAIRPRRGIRRKILRKNAEIVAGTNRFAAAESQETGGILYDCYRYYRGTKNSPRLMLGVSSRVRSG